MKVKKALAIIAGLVLGVVAGWAIHRFVGGWALGPACAICTVLVLRARNRAYDNDSSRDPFWLGP